MKLLYILFVIGFLFISIQTAVIPSTKLLHKFTKFNWKDDSNAKLYTIDLHSPVRIKFTDLSSKGKGFQIYDNSKLMGETFLNSEKTMAGTSNTSAYGFFTLEKGHHVLKLKLKKGKKGKGTLKIMSGNEYTFILCLVTCTNYRFNICS